MIFLKNETPRYHHSWVTEKPCFCTHQAHHSKWPSLSEHFSLQAHTCSMSPFSGRPRNIHPPFNKFIHYSHSLFFSRGTWKVDVAMAESNTYLSIFLTTLLLSTEETSFPSLWKKCSVVIITMDTADSCSTTSINQLCPGTGRMHTKRFHRSVRFFKPLSLSIGVSEFSGNYPKFFRKNLDNWYFHVQSFPRVLLILFVTNFL